MAALGLYFAVAPTVSFLVESWWPMLLGLGGLLGVMCVLLAIGVVRQDDDEQETPDTDDLPRPRRTVN